MTVPHKKVVLFGLDNAGKTSFLQLVQNKMVNAATILPTKGISRSTAEVLGQEICIHDLGGQEGYRENYLKEGLYFEETDAAIFMVDLQDKARYGVALDYFDRSVKLFKEMEVKSKVYLFFHKFDGDYLREFREYGDVREGYNDLLDDFIEVAEKHGYGIADAFQTSIYDEWVCYKAISQVWQTIVKKMEGIQDFLDKITKDNPDIAVALLLDKKGTMLAHDIKESKGRPIEELGRLGAQSIKVFSEWEKSLAQMSDGVTSSSIFELEGETLLLQKLNTTSGDYYIIAFCSIVKAQEVQSSISSLSSLFSIFLSSVT